MAKISKDSAGRPPNVNGRDPKYLIRFMRVLHAFQKSREDEYKYESAMQATQKYLLDEYSMVVSETEIKRILAASHDPTKQFEFAVRPYRDEQGREGMALYEREKPAYPHPSVRQKTKIDTK